MKSPVLSVKKRRIHDLHIKEAFRLQAKAHDVADECVIDKNTYAEISDVSGCFKRDGKWIVYDTDERAHVCEEVSFPSELSAFQHLAERLNFHFDTSVIYGDHNEMIPKDIPEFAIGDTVRVQVRVMDGSYERLQAFEGVVVARRMGSVRETFTVRRTTYGVGIERTFPLHSPRVDSIRVIRRGNTRRRGKKYYLHRSSSKDVRIKDET